MRSRNSYERQLLNNCLIRLVYSQIRRLTKTVWRCQWRARESATPPPCLEFLRYLTAGKPILRLSRQQEKQCPWQTAVLPLSSRAGRALGDVGQEGRSECSAPPKALGKRALMGSRAGWRMCCMYVDKRPRICDPQLGPSLLRCKMDIEIASASWAIMRIKLVNTACLKIMSVTVSSL